LCVPGIGTKQSDILKGDDMMRINNIQAIREYTVVKNGQIVLNMPEYFEELEVEVIILPGNKPENLSERTVFRRYDINELVKKMPENYHSEEVNWGSPLGKEIW
jgi:antitoxin component of MazEF toxin-antitoxin module